MDERNNPRDQGQAMFRQPGLTETVMDQAELLTSSGFRPLGKQEREEAARIALESGFSLTVIRWSARVLLA